TFVGGVVLHRTPSQTSDLSPEEWFFVGGVSSSEVGSSAGVIFVGGKSLHWSNLCWRCRA
ncbi:unnamed protein product, partial [Ilex paraguariensis]